MRTNSSMKKKHRRQQLGKMDSLPQDIIVEIATYLASTSPNPLQDVKSLRTTCKMFYEASKAKKVGRFMCVNKERERHCWVDKQGYLKFLEHCAMTGNLQACFILGLEKIYNKEELKSGFRHLQQAMMGGHLTAAYSLAIHLFRYPEKRTRAMEILKMVSYRDKLSGDHEVADQCTFSGNPHIQKCREEAEEVLRCITLNRMPMEQRTRCGEQFCGRTVADNNMWVTKDKLYRRFCSELCAWTEEYHRFFEKL